MRTVSEATGMSVAERPAGMRELPAGFSFHGLIPAGGRGERFGGRMAKQFVQVAGRPVVAHAVDRLLDAGAVSVVVALPEDAPEAVSRALTKDSRVTLVEGGATRQASVAAALGASPATASDLVAVHDGARPATTMDDLAAVLLSASEVGAAVLGRALADTLKKTSAGRILGTLDRSGLFRAETPQVFRRELLDRAFEAARRDRFLGTDESSLVERLAAVEIAAVEARHPNPKLTLAADLRDIEPLLQLLAETRG